MFTNRLLGAYECMVNDLLIKIYKKFNIAYLSNSFCMSQVNHHVECSNDLSVYFGFHNCSQLLSIVIRLETLSSYLVLNYQNKYTFIIEIIKFIAKRIQIYPKLRLAYSGNFIIGSLDSLSSSPSF